MTDPDPPVGHDALQFDRVIPLPGAEVDTGVAGVTCAVCHSPIEREYFDVNGNVMCDDCRASVEAATEVPSGVGPMLAAGVFGLGAGVAGAAIYYGVMAIANLEIGIVAILIGYMVGYGVRHGARGRGGRRFQVLAAALTYASVALAYTPMVVTQAIKVSRARQADSSSMRNAAPMESRDSAPLGVGGFLLGTVILAASVAALPALVAFSSFPSGLLSAIIIGIGMRQAWTMTGAPMLQILGPYRVGDRTASASA